MTPEALQRIEEALRLHMIAFGEQERADLRALLEERRELLAHIYTISLRMFEGIRVAHSPQLSPNSILVATDVWERMNSAPPTTPSPEEAK